MTSAVRVDDLARPRLPWPLRAANALGGPLLRRRGRLDAVELLAAARKQAGLQDFGDGRFLEPLRVLLGELDGRAELSPLGRVFTRQMLTGLLITRLLVQDLVTRYPEIADEPIDAPIVIAGLPRTGTTHLHNLLSRDPALRWLPYWQSLQPVLKPGAEDGRRRRCEQALRLQRWAMPLFPLMHEMDAELPHEEIQLLAVDFSGMLFEAAYHVPAYRDWYQANDQTASYRYLRLLLQVLQWSDGDRRRWVLKSPQHLEQLGPLLAAFPDAVVVQTHRDPVAITASTCTMLAYGRRMNARRVDLRELGSYWAARVEDLLRGSVEDRHLVPSGQVRDVRFVDFMSDQVGSVENVYELAGQGFTPEARKAVEGFIAANPRGKLGRIDYRLEDFFLDPAERRAALRFYQDRFDVPSEA